MHRASRVASITLLALATFAACKKKPQTVATPAPEPQPAAQPPSPPPSQPECDAACMAARDKERMDAAIREATARLTATIYFAYDRSEITDESRSTLDAKVPVLTQNTGVRIRIAGHTDSRGSDEYNLALGQRRAAAAKRYLTDRGIDGSRIEIVSFGEERPTCTDEVESCWSRNRRDEFEITGGSITAVQTSSR